jgi:hypothetical protein
MVTAMSFFRVGAGQSAQCYAGEWDPYPRDLYALHTDGPIPEGMTIGIRKGRKPGDMILGAFGVVSTRFVSVLKSIGATGYTTFPAPLTKRGREVYALGELHLVLVGPGLA